MATLPGTIVAAQSYHEYMMLYTAGEKVECVVDGAKPGPLGRLFVVETNKAVRVPYEAGRFILDHLGYTGVVRVTETEREDGTGIEFDLEEAKEASLAKFELEDERRWQNYVEYCITDKINNKKAVPATPDSIKRLIQRRGYKLADFGISPVGEKQPTDKAMEQLQALVAQQSAQMAAQSKQIESLTKKLKELGV